MKCLLLTVMLGATQAVAQTPAPGGDAAPTTAEAPPVTATAEPNLDRRAYKVSATGQYRMLAVNDPDPANDRAILWRLGAAVDVFENARAVIRFGLNERFVAEQGDSAFRIQDTLLALNLDTPFDVGGVEIGLLHEAGVFLPTSRASQRQDLYLAPKYAFQASIEVIKDLSLYVSPGIRYRIHQYAERAGYDGALNTRFEIEARAGFDQALAEFGKGGKYGRLGVGASAGSVWLKKYEAVDDHESSSSDPAVWLQLYDWEAHLQYTPVKYLAAAFSIEHGGGVLRDGIVNTFFTHRDETELAFTLSASY